ncbi:protein kinase domain-containing protein [Coleofasciculus sp. F4-SAH-05]|uniref:protein kinase domain-containing protein n=1 Tax=Coleofasciculus sp. F4-SAH-05 TaxID=3069525 RepID=UPI0032F7DC4A
MPVPCSLTNKFAHFNRDNRQYLVQEYIPGYDLAQMLIAQGAFTEQQIRDFLNSLLQLLEFIHRHNVKIHNASVLWIRLISII